MLNKEPHESIAPEEVRPSDKLLLFAIVLSIPFQDVLPSVKGVSLTLVLYASSVFWLVLTSRFRVLHEGAKAYSAAMFFFMIWIGFVEYCHDSSDYSEILRYAKSFVGTLILFHFCALTNTTSHLFYCLVATCLISSVVLVMYSGGVLRGEAISAVDADELRVMHGKKLPFRVNLNELSYFISIGCIVCFVRGMESAQKSRLHWVLFGIVFLGQMVTVSRGGMLATAAGLLLYLALYNRQTGKVAVFLLIAGSMISVFGLPDVLVKRTGVRRQRSVDKNVFTRANVYEKVVLGIGENSIFGVGWGGYWGYWGLDAGLAKYKRGHVPPGLKQNPVVGAHSGPLQVAICWGAPSAFLYMLSYMILFFRVPSRRFLDTDGRVAVVLWLGGLVHLCFSHNLASKDLTVVMASLLLIAHQVCRMGPVGDRVVPVKGN